MIKRGAMMKYATLMILFNEKYLFRKLTFQLTKKKKPIQISGINLLMYLRKIFKLISENLYENEG